MVLVQSGQRADHSAFAVKLHRPRTCRARVEMFNKDARSSAARAPELGKKEQDSVVPAVPGPCFRVWMGEEVHGSSSFSRYKASSLVSA